MRTSAKWTLAISIALLVIGIALTGYGLYENMDKVIERSFSNNGFSYRYYQSRVSGNSQVALCYLVYGYLVFISGLATMGYFVYLATHPVDKKKPVEKKAEPKKPEAEVKPQPILEKKEPEVQEAVIVEEAVEEVVVPVVAEPCEDCREEEELPKEEN